MQAIGGFFRGARLAHGLKAEEVALRMAALLGSPVSPATVYKIEGARMNPGLDLVLALLRALELDPRALVAVGASAASKAHGSEIGRHAVRGDTAWIDELTESQRRQLGAWIDLHD